MGDIRIAVDDNGEVSWQTHGGLNRVVGGRCVFESGILFMDEQEYDEAIQSKRDFLRQLNELPKWDKSVAWCRSLVLSTCRQKQTETSSSVTYTQDTMNEYSFYEKPQAPYLNQYKEANKSLFLLGFNWLEKIWHHIRGGKRWLKYLVPLFVVGLLLGLASLWYSMEEKAQHSSHRHKYHDHKHDD